MNYKKLPKYDEVEQIGNVQIIDLTDENREHVLETAISMYVGKPCRICGNPVTREDFSNHAVFAGYSADNKSRTAHKECWDANIPKNTWAYPKDEE